MTRMVCLPANSRQRGKLGTAVSCSAITSGDAKSFTEVLRTCFIFVKGYSHFTGVYN